MRTVRIDQNKLVSWLELAPDESKGVRIAVVGGNMRESLLPGMLQSVLREMDVTHEVVPIQVDENGFESCIQHLREIGFRGAAIASPHKVLAARMAEKFFLVRTALGLANGLRFEETGIYGQNTESPAITSLLKDVEPATAMMMGAGSGARSVAAGLMDSGWKVRIWNRNGLRARMMQSTMERYGHLELIAQPQPIGCTLVVNATHLGQRAGEKPPVDWTRAIRGTTAMDLVYRRVPTEFLREAANRGFKTIDGRQLVAEKTALCLEWWLSRTDVPREPLLRAAGMKV